MKTTYEIICRETGDVIETAENYEFAEYIVSQYEKQDKEDGSYSPDFYQIIVKTEA